MGPAASVSQAPVPQVSGAPVPVAAKPAPASTAGSFAGILQAFAGGDMPVVAASHISNVHPVAVHPDGTTAAKSGVSKIVTPKADSSIGSDDTQPATAVQTSAPVRVVAELPPVPMIQTSATPPQPPTARIPSLNADNTPVAVTPSVPASPSVAHSGKSSKPESKTPSTDKTTDKTETAPNTAVAVPQILEPRLRPQPLAAAAGSPPIAIAPSSLPSSSNDAAPAIADHAPAVEVKVHFNNSDAQSPASVAASPTPVSIPLMTEKQHAPSVPQVQLAAAPSNAAPPATAAIAQAHDMRVSRYEQPATAPASRVEAVLPEETKASPQLRSVALEFTPDGSQDVRVRLTEHAGDVHISLHSTDPSLAGRLSDGVQDLVGSLAHAGYDAQAWTSDQHQRNQQQQNPEEQTKTRRGSTDSADFNEFINPKEFA